MSPSVEDFERCGDARPLKARGSRPTVPLTGPVRASARRYCVPPPRARICALCVGITGGGGFFFFCGGSALDVAAETHGDRQCGGETLLTFVYKCRRCREER